MRLTEFWARMEQALGVGYARSWAADYRLAGLSGRTVEQALQDGDDTLAIWRAVHEALDLPAKYR